MQYDHKQNLAFLLSMAALPMAGCVITSSDDDGDTGDSGSASNSNSNTNGDDGTTTGADSTSGASVEGTGSDSVGDTGSTGVVDDTGATTGGEVPTVCIDAGAHFEKCMIKDPMAIIDECVYYVTYPANTPECTTANEDYYACLAMADCEGLTGKENPCQAEQDAIFAACVEGGTTGGEGTTGG